VQYESITSERDLIAFCDRMAGAKSIAFDTEFVSEDCYRPDLCLVQVAVERELAIIDTKQVGDATAFWRMLASGRHETVVHAGREELRFCLSAAKRRPSNLFDIQIAAGLAGLEYPASLKTLVWKLLGETLPKGETRTDWRRRPLSRQQIEYALRDAVFLPSLRDALFERLDKLGRLDWLTEEMDAWQTAVEKAESHDRWRRVSGLSGLSRRCLAIVRELWLWRETEAERRNRPARRVLRDDLIVELAKRKTADAKRIRAVRGLQRGDLKQHLGELGKCIGRALALPDDQCPESSHRKPPRQLNVLGQFLATALGSRCRAAQLAPALAGSVQDVRDLIAFRLDQRDASDHDPPLLARGWRAEILGNLVEDLLAGKLSIRIKDPLSDEPLAFEPTHH